MRLQCCAGSLEHSLIAYAINSKISCGSSFSFFFLFFSDQNDPFNRQPLSLDMVIPNDELRKKIKDWIDEKKQKKS